MYELRQNGLNQRLCDNKFFCPFIPWDDGAGKGDGVAGENHEGSDLRVDTTTLMAIDDRT